MKELEILKGDFTVCLPLPYADGGIKAGFPSPAQDYLDNSLDFNTELIRHPAATFYAKVKGESMTGAGIDCDDIIVIDRALEPRDGDIVVAYIDGEFTLKYLDTSEKKKGRIWLRAANENYPDIKVTKDNEFLIWGVVSKVIKNFR